MLHIGDYIFLVASSFCIYVVGLRLVEWIHGRADAANQSSQSKVDDRSAGAPS